MCASRAVDVCGYRTLCLTCARSTEIDTQRYSQVIRDNGVLPDRSDCELGGSVWPVRLSSGDGITRAEGWPTCEPTSVWHGSGEVEGLKVPFKQPKRGRLWLNDGSCIRLRPSWQHHVWAHDFVQARTNDGRAFRMLTVNRSMVLARVPGHRGRPSHSFRGCAACVDRPNSPWHGPPHYIGSDVMAASAPHRRCGTGCRVLSARRRSTSSPARRGRTATTRASTASSGKSC